MWALILRRLRLLVILAVLLPVIAVVSGRLGGWAERRHAGPTPSSRALRLVESTAHRAADATATR